MATAPSGSGDEGFRKWKDGIDRANGDWDYYDAEIRRVVNEYNMHLRNAPHFHLLDWLGEGDDVDRIRTTPGRLEEEAHANRRLE
jgi:hypothetical protein